MTREGERPREPLWDTVAEDLSTALQPYCVHDPELVTLSRMREQSIKFLQTLVNTPSPSGHEVRGQRVWLNYVSNFADETFTDAYGNAVAVLNKGGSPRVMLAGHADEIAMTVNFINKDGFIYVRRLGGIDPTIVRAQRVTIHTRKGPVRGVVG